MKFIRVKVKSLRVEAEALLHTLIDKGLSMTVEVPLPDVYKKTLSH
jgi:hypothetical protein